MSNIINFDEKTSYYFNRLVTDSNLNHIFWRGIAEFATYLIPVWLVYTWFTDKTKRDTSVRAAVVGVIGWKGLAPLVANFMYRERPVDLQLFPYKTVLPPKEVIFNRPDYSFPSDHAIFLFAVASSYYFAGYKKTAYYLFTFAILVSLSRVVVGVHYLGDIAVGAIIGIFISWIAWRWRTKLDIVIVKPFIILAKWIKI